MASPWPERLHIRQMTLAYREHDVRLQRIEVARLGTAPVALSVDRIDGSMVGLPFWASARLRSGEIGWQANGVLASGSGEVVLRFDGANLGGDDGSLRLVTDRLHFAPDGLQPAALWPTLGAFFSSVSGTLQAELTWPEGPAALLIEDLGSRTPYGPVGPIDGRIELSGIQPPRTAMPQRLRIEGVQLEALVEGLAIEALDAAGTIDADLRFSFKDSGRLHIDEGEIRSRGPGVLRYRAGGPPGALADQGESVAFMLRALGDFRYETLTATVRGYLDEDLTIALQLQGANPELYEGHPIELNVNLEAPFLPLALAGRKVMALPAMVRDALARHQD
jgi:hypothetical protein